MKLKIDRARQSSSCLIHYRKQALLSGVAALGLGLAVTLGFSSPAAARYGLWYPASPFHTKHHAKHTAEPVEHLSKEPFGDLPKGPLQIVISINQEKLHLYADGTQVTEVPVATGLPGHPTPMGVFSVIQKDRYHHSNIYSGAPMPYMQRITWSGVAMHEGTSLGHPASHGCIRMPHDFAQKLWVLTKLGVRVIVARNEPKPVPFADSHLFVHKDQAPAAAAADPIKTAQSVDDTKKTDAVDAKITRDPAAEPAKTASEPDKAATASAPAAEVNETIVPKTISGDAPVDAASQSTASQSTASQSPANPAADPAKPADTTTAAEAVPLRGTSPTTQATSQATSPMTAPIATPDENVPVPLPKPTALTDAAAASHGPIAIFVSRKEKKIFVRQHFTPLFAAPITIAHPEQPLGTHVFTAMAYQDDNSTFRWNVMSLNGEPARAQRSADTEFTYDRHGRRRIERAEAPAAEAPPQSPSEALARLDIPQDVVDQISALMVPGSSLIVSDQGLGPETGEGTDFIVLNR